MYANTLRTSAVCVRRLRVGASALGPILALALWLAAPPAARANVSQFQNGYGISLVSQSQSGREIGRASCRERVSYHV